MKRTNGIVLVGQVNGRRKIRWGVAFLLSCAFGIICASLVTAFYFVLAGQTSLLAALFGFLMPFSLVGHGIGNACRLPVEQLNPFETRVT